MFEVSIRNPSTYRNHRRGDCHWLHSRPGAEVRRSSSALHSRVSFVNSQLSFFSSTSTVPASSCSARESKRVQRHYIETNACA